MVCECKTQIAAKSGEAVARLHEVGQAMGAVIFAALAEIPEAVTAQWQNSGILVLRRET